MADPAAPWAPVAMSKMASRTSNPIRAIVDNMKVTPNPDKAMISLAIGDPTLFGNFKTPDSGIAAITDALASYKFNGYPPAHGYEFARAAVARAHTRPTAPVTADDVVIASGCSGALELAMTVLANEGQNVLVPRPGFSLYQVIADAYGMETRHYDLLPERNWEISLSHLESLIDDKTAFVLINNPSNPCGSVYSEQHLRDLLALCERRRLPVISDEIYADMVFGDHKFVPLANLSTRVPILTTGGIAKRYMVPGWRLGWVLVHDRQGLFAHVRTGLVRLSQIVLGANSLVQSALPALLESTSASYYTESIRQLETNAMYTCERINKIAGLQAIVPAGTMYVMVRIDTTAFRDLADDTVFSERLVQEQSVFVLPGKCFVCPGFFRIVFTPPKDKLVEAYDRLEAFCAAHRR